MLTVRDLTMPDPLVLGPEDTALLASMFVNGATLFALGAGITLLTGRGVLQTAVRQLDIGVGAAALTYGLGRLLAAAGTSGSMV